MGRAEREADSWAIDVRGKDAAAATAAVTVEEGRVLRRVEIQARSQVMESVLAV